MKKKIAYLSLILLLYCFFVACEEDTTTNAIELMTATVGGQEWAADVTAEAFIANDTVFVRGVSSNNSFILLNFFAQSATNLDVVDIDSLEQSTAATFYLNAGDTLYFGTTGIVNIIKFDLENKQITGTFDFEAFNFDIFGIEEDAIIDITDGVFDVPLD